MRSPRPSEAVLPPRPFPLLEAYIAGLPRGLDAFPTHATKGAVVRQILLDANLGPHVDSLPPQLAALIKAPPPHSSWVPEVFAIALFMAMRDIHPGPDAAFLEAVRQSNLKLLSGVVYGVIFKLIGPARLVSAVESRWGQMHKGVSMAPVVPVPDGAKVCARMEFPAGLVPPLMCQGYAQAFKAAVEVAGCSNVSFVVREAISTRAVFVGSWD